MLKRLVLNTDRRCLFKFVYNLGVKGTIGLNRFQKRLKKGEFFPAFHFISVTDDCNLHCQGCWVTGKITRNRLDVAHLNRIIMETKKKGSFFFGILGGEPLLYKPLFEVFREHSDCYFQLFTNGTLLTREVAEELRHSGNVTPLISFEGDQTVADERRGGDEIYQRTLQGIDHATKAGLVTGVAVSVCKSNLDFALSDEFIRLLIQKNVTYLWYYIYRPAGENPMPELALDYDDIYRLRHFMVNARTRFDLVIIDAYWDENGNGLCPAATGLSHHINAAGYIEPCPVIQFSREKSGEASLADLYSNSAFLRELRQKIPAKTSGCVFMEDPEWVADFAEKYNAMDTSGRGNETARLKQMTPFPSHGSVAALREKSWFYRFAKRKAFFGLGAYG